MINFEQLLAVFPECLQTQPNNFSPKALQDLDTLLATVSDSTEEELIKALKS